MLKQITYKIRGMQQDLVVSSFNPMYSLENMNIRLSPSKDTSFFGITNEKGTKDLEINIPGIPIGMGIIKNQIIIFTTIEESENAPQKDFIHKVTFVKEEPIIEKLYEGNLKFSSENPIETLVSYESESIQKVYWTDAKNQLRLINIATGVITDNTTFDFIRDLSSSIGSFQVKIEKIQSGLGVFPSGVIQYFITGYNKKMQESNILYYSPLYYMSPESRGGTAEEKCTNSFVLNFKINTGQEFNWTNLRVYSIHRTSLNATVAAYLVADVEVNKEIIIQDNGNNEALSDTEILFKTRSPLVVGTLTQKMQTLFVGNIQYNSILSEKEERELQKEIQNHIYVKEEYKKIPYYDSKGLYPYKNNLDKSNDYIKHFKGGEKYRLGIQLMDKYGCWTNPLYIADFDTVNYPKIIDASDESTNQNMLYLPILSYRFLDVGSDGSSTADFLADLKKKGFIAYRALRATPVVNHKSVLCQGVLSQTVYKLDDRAEGNIYAQSSWFFRPLQDTDTTSSSNNNSLEYLHNNNVGLPNSTKGEIQSASSVSPYLSADDVQSTSFYSCKFYFESTFKRYKCLVLNTVGQMIEGIEASSSSDVIRYLQKQYIGETTVVDITEEEWKNATFENPIIKTFNEKFNIDQYTQDNKYNYLIDSNFLTLHSPDINDNSYNNINDTELALRIVGIVPITANTTSYDIQYTGAARKPYSEGIIQRNYNHDNISDKANGLISGGLFIDEDSKNVLRCFVTYPWHRNGSLGDQGSLKLGKDEAKIATLSKKVFSNLRYSWYTKYFSTDIRSELYWDDSGEVHDIINKPSLWNTLDSKGNINSSKIAVFNSTEDTLLKIYSGNNNYWYKGNVDTILSPKIEKDGNDIKGYNIYTTTRDYNIDSNLPITYDTNYDRIGTEPVSIKYKSTNHAVLKLGTNNNKNIILPNLHIESLYSSEVVDKERNYFTANTQGLYALDYNPNNYKGVITNIISEDNINNVCITDNVGKYYLVKNSSSYYKLIKVIQATGHVDYEPILCDSTDRWLDNLCKNYWSPIKISADFVKWEQTSINGYYQDTITLKIPSSASQVEGALLVNNNSGILYLAELYNPNATHDDIYGVIPNIDNDTHKYITSSISWVPASEIQYLNETWEAADYITQLEGDTYFSRWDCLKTYPFTQEDQNKVVEILSFMVESQINLDGRTDRNRGAANNNYMSPTNFNLFNEVYNQDNNYFIYRFVKNETNKLNNTIAWSTVKNNTADIDDWTRIRSTTSIDVSNLYGEIQKLYSTNNNLYFFQNGAIGKLRYNENAIITTDSGIPTELGNSGTVTGYNYITTSIGLPDKWAICDGNNSIYFVDINSLGIYKLSDDNIENLAASKGFLSWLDKNKSIGWNPKNFDGFVLYYNNIDKELYIISREYCLTYSDLLNEFSSFYSYENSPYYCNIDSNKFFIKHSNNTTSIWQQHKGMYNGFFGKIKENSITIVANPEPNSDKVFNTVEFRADVFDPTNITDNTTKPFNYLKVWNEYQESNNQLQWTYNNWAITNLKRKFRIWRINNFRDNDGKSRIRNPWAYFKLINTGRRVIAGKEFPDNHKKVLHDIVIGYFV